MSKQVEIFGVYRCLFTIFLFSKIFGLCPFAIGTKGKYILDKKSAAINLGIILIYGGFAVYHIHRGPVHDEAPDIMILIEILAATVRLLTFCVVTVWGIVQRKKILQLLEDISGFDKDINVKHPLAQNNTYRSDRLFSVVTVLVITNLLILLLATNILALTMRGKLTYLALAKLAAYHSPDYVTCAIALQLSALATLLGRRFAIINSELEKLTECWNNRMIYVSRTSNAKSTRTCFCLTKNELQGQLHSLRSKHFHLHSMSKSLNQIYTFQLSFVILRIFLDLINISLYLYKRQDLLSDVWNDARAFLVLAIAAVQLLLIALSCSYAANQLKETGPILHEIRGTDEDIDEDVRFFSVQILQYDFKITAMNVLTMDRPLITTVSAGVASYLFLVIQLNQAQTDAV